MRTTLFFLFLVLSQTCLRAGIAFSDIGSKSISSPPFDLIAVSSNALPVTYEIVGGNLIASVSGNTVTLTGNPGSVTIKASDGVDVAYESFVVVEGALFESISHGQGFVLGIKTDGSLWAWGSLDIGESEPAYDTLARIGSAYDWSEVAAGSSGAWFLKDDGSLWCASYAFQIYGGGRPSLVEPVQLAPGTIWTAIAEGVGVKSDGTLWSLPADTESAPSQIGTSANWLKVDGGPWQYTGQRHSLALKTNGTLWARGRNHQGQLGDGTTTNQSNYIPIGTDTDWVEISAGTGFSMARKSDGSIWAWGGNTYGQLGDGTTGNRLVPGRIGTDSDWVAISAGSSHGLAIKQNGTLWTWGQIAGDGTAVTAPIQMGSMKWSVISAGLSHSVALGQDGSLWHWGGEAFGSFRPEMVKTPLIPIHPMPWQQVSAGSSFSLARKLDGTIWSRGDNTFGQLGNGTTTPNSDFQTIGTDNDWIDVSGGDQHALAVKSDGTLWSWGTNSEGQLGDGTKNSLLAPSQVGSGQDWTRVWGAASCSIAQKTDGSLWSWGASWGALGLGIDGSLPDQLSPARIGTDSDWAMLSAYSHVLALKKNGSLWAWGGNFHGELGIGTTSNAASPVQVASGQLWKSVSSGHGHSLAVRADGTLWAWGRNVEYQLGDGTGTNRTSPVQIGTDTDWRTVAAGYNKSRAIKADGSLYGWGGWEPDAPRLPTRIGISNGWKDFPPLREQESTMVLSAAGVLWKEGQLVDSWELNHTRQFKRFPDRVPQSVSFMPVPALDLGETATLVASSTSGLPLSYAVRGPATLTGTQLTLTGPGNVIVEAWQAGDGHWQAAQPASITVSLNPAASFSLWATNSGLIGNDTLPTATPFGDGVENLLKYAFNMNTSGPDVSVLVSGTGTSGLPTVSFDAGAPQPFLRVEFLRRKASGLIYTPMVSTSLTPESFNPMTGPATVTDINDDWERVIAEQPCDPQTAPACFAVVRVALP